MINPLSGLYVDDDGEIRASVFKQDTWVPTNALTNAAVYDNTVPDAFLYKPYSTLTATQKQTADKFYQTLAAKTGKTVAYLFDNRHYAVPSANWVSALAEALQATTNLDSSQAFGLANYAGGAVQRKGVVGGMSPVRPANGIIDFLDVGRLYSEGTKQTVSIEKALLKLKQNNPGAFEYVVNLIAAKAAKRQQQADVSLAKDTQKVINKELEIVKKVATTVGNVGEGALDTVTTAGSILKYLPWIIGGVLVVGGYVLYRNRETVGKIAKARIGL